MLSNGHLRIYQIVVFLVSGTAGLVISIAMAWTSKIVKGQCVLYSNMDVKKRANGSIYFSMETSQWGTQMQCQFSTFCPVGLTIYCVIWMWFYIFLSDWGTSFILSNEEKAVTEPGRPPPDQHLLIPSIVCNVLVFGLILTTVAMVEAGRSVWCENIRELLKETSCSYVHNVSWVNLTGGSDIYRYLTHATVACWVLLVSMVIQTVIIFVRLRRNSQQKTSNNSLTESSDSDECLLSCERADSAAKTPRTPRRLQRQKTLSVNSGTLRTEAEMDLLSGEDEEDLEQVA